MKGVVFSNPFVIVFVAGTVLSFILNHLLEFIDWRARVRSGGKIPAELQEIPAARCFDAGRLGKICAYENAKYFSWIFSSLLLFTLSLILVFSGFYPWAYGKVCGIFASMHGFAAVYLSTFFFVISASLPEVLLSVPFNLYNEFRIERKFGFSNMTPRLWLSDNLKGLFVSLVTSAVLLAAMIGVLSAFPKAWWIFLTAVLFAFTLIMQFVYPMLIAPLFNKFVPLEDGELKSKILSLMEGVGFKASGIFIVDASKRSGHSNAYFTGIGPSKRIVLYDTLVKQLTIDEVVAVLAHEFGHYKLKHILRRICVLLPLEFALMFTLSLLSQSPSLYVGFGFDFGATVTTSFRFVGLFLASLVAGSLQEVLSPLANYFSRKDEYAADKFSANLTKNPDALISGLVKLNSENLSELLPPKIYVIWNYSHPTLLERIRVLKNFSS